MSATPRASRVWDLLGLSQHDLDPVVSAGQVCGVVCVDGEFFRVRVERSPYEEIAELHPRIARAHRLSDWADGNVQVND